MTEDNSLKFSDGCDAKLNWVFAFRCNVSVEFSQFMQWSVGNWQPKTFSIDLRKIVVFT